MKTRAFFGFPLSLLLVVFGSVPAARQAPVTVDEVLGALNFRNIGPFRTAAWVTEVAVPETPARDHLPEARRRTRSTRSASTPTTIAR